MPNDEILEGHETSHESKSKVQEVRETELSSDSNRVSNGDERIEGLKKKDPKSKSFFDSQSLTP